MLDPRHLVPLLAVVMVSSALAGCLTEDANGSPDQPTGPPVSNDHEAGTSGSKDDSTTRDPVDPNGSEAEEEGGHKGHGYPACQHPWPCGNGSAWPSNLTAQATSHPRQPPELPHDLEIQDGTVADRTRSNVTFRWGEQVTPLAQTEPTGDQPSDSETYRTTFDVPSGLYQRVDADLTWSGEDPPLEGEAVVELTLLDPGGDTICWARASSGVALAADDMPVAYVPADRRIRCTSGPLEPLEDPAEWTVEVVITDNVDAVERFDANITIGLVEPRPIFDLDRLEKVEVESFDGTTLGGWIYRPDVPEGVEVPVALTASVYPGQTAPTPGDRGYRSWGEYTNGADPMLLVQEGYAVAVFNVRGTGASGGCFDMFGDREQRDMARLVDWLGNRTWSNGRVGMTGLSYPGTTPIEAAIQNPDPLKTIVTTGIVSDLYTFYHTPQGAVWARGTDFQASFEALVTGPRLDTLQNPDKVPERSPAWLQRVPEKACPEVAETMISVGRGTASDDRNRGYWEERRFIDDFPNITTSILLAHGFEDRWTSMHQQQEPTAWRTLPDSTPKYQLEGQWKHEFPNRNSYNPDWTVEDWNQRLLGWLDFWLKGVGDPPDELGTVDYQDGTGTWHETTSWPPADAQQEVLHLTDDRLRPFPNAEERTFHSVPDAAGSQAAREGVDEGIPGPLCSRQTPAGEPVHGLLYTSRSLGQDTLVAGNPFAHLNLTSSQPGGLVTVTLFDLGPRFACEGATPHDALPLTTGTADLRFHAGNMQGKDFPTDEPTGVRVDLTNLAEVVPRGHQVGVLISYGDPDHRTSQPYTPQITVHGDSEIIVPVVDGTLGGREPLGEFPPRPFVPTTNSAGGSSGEATAVEHGGREVPSAGLGELLGGLLGGLLGVRKGARSR